MARPSSLSLPIVESICVRLEAGEPLAQICRDDGMPGVRTFLEWADRNEDVASLYSRARDAQGEHLDAEIQRISETAVDRETAAAARVQIAALQWRASKQAPKKYGERVDLNVDHTFDLAAVLDKRRQRVLDANERMELPGPDAEQ